MRIALLFLTAITAILGIIMVVLPFGSIAIIPGAITILLGLVAYTLSKKQQKPKKISLLFLVIGVLVIVTSTTKIFWINDEIAVDKEFQKKEAQSKEDAIKELKEIESELEGIESE